MTDFAAVDCSNLCKSFGAVQAVQDVSFALCPGQFMALLGPSGCGKTTVLRLIAGLEMPDAGTIAIGGRVVTGGTRFVPAHRRRVGMVFQDYALFPHMTVEQNVAYGLSRGNHRHARVAEMLALVGLEGFNRRYPHELSGGQQQRVALARALAPQPDVLLLDEPFSNLDVALRAQVREDVYRILHQAGITTILVTHDQDEAMSLADRIALMFEGTVVQYGSPRELYETPVSRRAAQFLGDVNVLHGHAQGDTALTALGTLPLRRHHQGDVDILVRPEHLTLNRAAEGTPATVKRCMYYGTYQDVWITLDGVPALKARCPAHLAWGAGDRVYVALNDAALAFPRTTA